MPGVRIRENEHFDAALRRFKSACEKAGVLTELQTPRVLREADPGTQAQEGRGREAAHEAQPPGPDHKAPHDSTDLLASVMPLKDRLTEDMQAAMKRRG